MSSLHGQEGGSELDMEPSEVLEGRSEMILEKEIILAVGFWTPEAWSVGI